MKDVLGNEIKQGDLVLKSSNGRSGGSHIMIGIYKGKSLYGFGGLVALEESDTLLNKGKYKRVSRLTRPSVLKLDSNIPKYKAIKERILENM